MKRAGFTMIELIFVIVILGILAAVALPKFAGVSDQANAQKCNAFVGTLNRTVGPSMWSASIANELLGNISTFSSGNTVGYLDVDTYVAPEDIPVECLDGATTIINTAGTELGNPTFGTTTYSLNITSTGDLSTSPDWSWEKN